MDPYASISNSKKNRLRKIAFAIGILMLMLAIGILCYAFIDFFNLSIGGKYLKAYAISFLIFGPVSILFFVMGVHFRKGLDLDILAGYTPSNYSKEQNNMVGKITGNYFIIEGFMVIVSIFIMNEFEDAVVSILAIVTLSIILLVIHVNYRLKR
ncbi:hypothetical protein FC83_GL003235 [Agrilactobacillus composti DSM 18527 = JCM 14202]|uniref:Uncharacterized protein n=1 Tax=Agrilactobacillus composti DSM 18527 = JCM 14202 TaxID=1423734 RepID=A0A0R1XSL0_9LACO|nr:hypothetical protein FC83_GL003235 [Agrilactobacillus composti DSM 18527 = JCM 14202]